MHIWQTSSSVSVNLVGYKNNSAAIFRLVPNSQVVLTFLSTKMSLLQYLALDLRLCLACFHCGEVFLWTFWRENLFSFSSGLIEKNTHISQQQRSSINRILMMIVKMMMMMLMMMMMRSPIKRVLMMMIVMRVSQVPQRWVGLDWHHTRLFANRC